VDAAATSGPRTLIVMSVGGESSAQPVSANTLQIARELGNNLQAITSAQVGVVVGTASTASAENRLAATAAVGVVVGPVASALQPIGAIKGSSGQLLISGQGLGGLPSGTISLVNPSVAQSGITLGSATVNAQGTQLTVPYSIGTDAPSASYKLSLQTASGSVLFAPASGNQFWVHDEPQISSLTPTVMQRGRAYTLTVRGSHLENVRSLSLQDANGVLPGVTVEANAVSFGTDTLGDKLTVRVVVDATTAMGPVVLRLDYAGGTTTSQASTANSINIVSP
jgi:hypothetical protein